MLAKGILEEEHKQSHSALKITAQYYDLSVPISDKTVTFPGDPTPKVGALCEITEHSHHRLKHMTLGNHLGTHIDFPAHVIKNGKTSSNYPISRLIGSTLIVSLPDGEKSITKAFIEKQSILKNDFVFLQTANAKLANQVTFAQDYVYLEPDAASALVKKGVKIVGIDYLSVDQYSAETLPVHHILLSNDVLIVEGLDLRKIPAGRYKVVVAPTPIAHMSGLPARVIAQNAM